MLTLAAGPGGVRQPGQVVDVDPAEAEQLVAGGYAERISVAQPAAVDETLRTAEAPNRTRTAVPPAAPRGGRSRG